LIRFRHNILLFLALTKPRGMLCRNVTVKPFLVSLVEPVAYLPRNSSPETLDLGGRSFDDLESQLGGFPFEIADLSMALLSLVEFHSSIHVLHPVAQHAVDQAGQLSRHGLNRNGGAQLGSESTELRSQIGVAYP